MHIGVQVSFQRPAYMFLESQGMVDVCVEKFGFTQETIQVILFGGMVVHISMHYCKLRKL